MDPNKADRIDGSFRGLERQHDDKEIRSLEKGRPRVFGSSATSSDSRPSLIEFEKQFFLMRHATSQNGVCLAL